jgi:hypothetical protein
MTESEYWVHLEYRLCREFAGLPDKRHRYLWCDGLDPFEYLLDGPAARITGDAWIGNGPRIAHWKFVFLLRPPIESREAIDWASLLPSENMTRWMYFEEDKKYLELDPAAATPDLPT